MARRLERLAARGLVVEGDAGQLDELSSGRWTAWVGSRPRRSVAACHRVGARVGATVEAAPAGTVALTSAGTLVYDLARRAVARRHLPRIDVLTPSAAAPTGPHPRLLLGASGPRRTAWTRRDAALIGLADRIVVVELRRGSSLVGHLVAALRRGAGVDVVVDEDGGPTRAAAPLTAAGARLLAVDRRPAVPPPPEIAPWPPAPGSPSGRWLIHFTRGRRGPWPGETYEAYLDEVLGGVSPWRSDRRALEHILTAGRIEPSGRLIRGGPPVVSFTAAPLSRASRLMVHRRGLGRRTFGPYGIALDRSVASGLGVRPVIYGDSGLYERLHPAQRFRYQRAECAAGTWQSEEEWRLAGALDLRTLPRWALRLVLPAEESAAAWRSATGLDVHLLPSARPDGPASRRR